MSSRRYQTGAMFPSRPAITVDRLGGASSKHGQSRSSASLGTAGGMFVANGGQGSAQMAATHSPKLTTMTLDAGAGGFSGPGGRTVGGAAPGHHGHTASAFAGAGAGRDVGASRPVGGNSLSRTGSMRGRSQFAKEMAKRGMASRGQRPGMHGSRPSDSSLGGYGMTGMAASQVGGPGAYPPSPGPQAGSSRMMPPLSHAPVPVLSPGPVGAAPHHQHAITAPEGAPMLFNSFNTGVKTRLTPPEPSVAAASAGSAEPGPGTTSTNNGRSIAVRPVPEESRGPERDDTGPWGGDSAPGSASATTPASGGASGHHGHAQSALPALGSTPHMVTFDETALDKAAAQQRGSFRGSPASAGGPAGMHSRGPSMRNAASRRSPERAQRAKTAQSPQQQGTLHGERGRGASQSPARAAGASPSRGGHSQSPARAASGQHLAESRSIGSMHAGAPVAPAHAHAHPQQHHAASPQSRAPGPALAATASTGLATTDEGARVVHNDSFYDGFGADDEVNAALRTAAQEEAEYEAAQQRDRAAYVHANTVHHGADAAPGRDASPALPEIAHSKMKPQDLSEYGPTDSAAHLLREANELMESMSSPHKEAMARKAAAERSEEGAGDGGASKGGRQWQAPPAGARHDRHGSKSHVDSLIHQAEAELEAGGGAPGPDTAAGAKAAATPTSAAAPAASAPAPSSGSKARAGAGAAAPAGARAETTPGAADPAELARELEQLGLKSVTTEFSLGGGGGGDSRPQITVPGPRSSSPDTTASMRKKGKGSGKRTPSRRSRSNSRTDMSEVASFKVAAKKTRRRSDAGDSPPKGRGGHGRSRSASTAAEEEKAAKAAASRGSPGSGGDNSPGVDSAGSMRKKKSHTRRRSFAGATAKTVGMSRAGNIASHLAKARRKSAHQLKRAKMAVEYDVKTKHTLQKSIAGAHIRYAAVVKDQVWCAHREGYISIRDPYTGEEIDSLQTEKDFVTCIIGVGNDRVWAGTSEGPIRIYDYEERELVKTLRDHLGYVYDMKRDQLVRAEVDQQYVWSCSNDFTCIQWSDEGYMMRQYTGHTNSMRCLLVLGPYLWTGSDDFSIRVYDTDTTECVAVLDRHKEAVLALCLTVTNTFSLTTGQDSASSESDISCVLSSSHDGTVRMWGLTAPYTCLRTLELSGRVQAMVPMGPEVWCAGEKGELAVWRSANMQVEAQLEQHTGMIGGLANVRKHETRYAWSLSVFDKQLNIWSQECDMLGPGERHKDPVEGALKAFSDEKDRKHAEAMSAMQKEQDNLKARLKAQADELEELRRRLEDHADLEAERARRHAAEDRVAELEELLAKMDKDNSDLLARLKHAEARNEALERKLKDKQAELDELRAGEEARMQELRDKIAQMEHDFALQLQKKQSELDDANEQLAHALDKIKYLKETLDRLRKENAELAPLASEVADLRAQLASLRDQLQRECERTLELEAQIEALLREREESEELKRLRDLLKKTKDEMDALRDQLAAERAEHAKLKKRFNQLDAFKLDFIGREMKVLQRTIGRARHELSLFDPRKLESKKDEDVAATLQAICEKILKGGGRHVEEIIADCFTESQRLHLGSQMQ